MDSPREMTDKYRYAVTLSAGRPDLQSHAREMAERLLNYDVRFSRTTADLNEEGRMLFDAAVLLGALMAKFKVQK